MEISRCDDFSLVFSIKELNSKKFMHRNTSNTRFNIMRKKKQVLTEFWIFVCPLFLLNKTVMLDSVGFWRWGMAIRRIVEVLNLSIAQYFLQHLNTFRELDLFLSSGLGRTPEDGSETQQTWLSVRRSCYYGILSLPLGECQWSSVPVGGGTCCSDDSVVDVMEKR